MAWQAPKGGPGVGLSSHKQSYSSPGTLQGNWAEERARRDAAAAGKAKFFPGDSVSHQDFGNAQDKIEAAKQYERSDLGKGRTDESGKCFVASRNASGQPLPCYATVSQLAYGGRTPAAEPQQVQQFLWTGHKHVDLGIPAGLPSGDARGEDLTATKAAEWRQDSQPEPFETTKTMAARPVVEALAKGQIMKRSSGRPADDNGAPAPVGRKMNGEFAKGLDQEWHHTGLRAPITAKGPALAPVPAAR